MQIQLNKQVKPLLERLSGHLSMPLFRNGYALVSSSFLSSAIGMGYWILAAHLYPASLVGVNSALISAMMLLGGIAQLNMMNAHIRFIPTAGKATSRLVGTTYIVGPIVAALVSLIFFALIQVVVPNLGFLRSSPVIAGVFIVATMLWCIFVLEDGVLTGLRRATWEPVENSMFGLAKIALMVALAAILPQLGVFFSWVLGLVVIVLPTTYFIFRSLIPAHEQAGRETDVLPKFTMIARYTAGDYLASLAWLACTSLLPIMVTAIAGATANAYYFLPWQIALLLYAVSGSMGSSLVVEASTHPKELQRLSMRVQAQLLLIVVPMAVVIIAGAPLILSLFGNGYTKYGTDVLRLLALSSIPYTVIVVFVSIARVRRRISRAIIAYISLSVLVLGLSAILLRRFGLIGVGYAWLGGQGLVALGILVIWFRKLIAAVSRDPAAPEVLHIGSLAILDPEIRRRSLAGSLVKLWRLVESASRTRLAARLWPQILEDAVQQSRYPFPTATEPQYIIQTQTDMAVFALGTRGLPPFALLKLPRSEAAASSAKAQARPIEAICAYPQLERLQSLLPEQIAAGEVAGQPYAIEKRLPGIDGRLAMANPNTRESLLVNAVEVITTLHAATAMLSRVDKAALDCWIEAPLERIAEVTRQLPGSRRYQAGIQAVGAALLDDLIGRETALSWIHGDFVPGNFLVSTATKVLSGIVDWELARPGELPLLDIYQLIFATRRETQGVEFGSLVAQALDGQPLTEFEQRLISANQESLPGDPIETRTMLLHFWLRHVGANLTKSSRYDRHWVWIYRNLLPVLDWMGRAKRSNAF
jgi:O-antigen/teichoic acid export membrane protein/aminoglycoside phosphotransferase (APT) family kinase protein